MSICIRCEKEFNEKKGKIYCSEYCSRKIRKQRYRRKRAHPRVLKSRTERKLRWRKPVIKAERLTLEGRLFAHSVPEPNSGCLLWISKVSKKGYALIWLDGRYRVANRAAYETWVGPIPKGMYVCHHCDVPICIEATHLYAGTAKSNHDDMVRRGRQNLNLSGLKAYVEAKRKPELSAYGRKRYAGAGI